MSLRAPSATASAAAAVSALTLSTCVGSSRSGATVETTGMRPASSRSSTAPGLTLTTSPTRPMSTLCAVDDRRPPTRLEQPAVLARQADGVRAVRVEQPDELARDLPGEHHPDDVHRLGRGDAQAAAELRLDAEPVEHRVDLRSAAVHDDRLEADLAQEHHVLRRTPA